MLVDGLHGQPVCGLLGVVHGQVLFTVINGTLNADKRFHDQGALSALYYHSIYWCYENGLQYSDFGDWCPHQTDGLYSYKVRWGMTTATNLWSPREWMFKPPRNESPALGWLERHPWVY